MHFLHNKVCNGIIVKQRLEESTIIVVIVGKKKFVNEARRVTTNGHPEGHIFLSYPHTINEVLINRMNLILK